MTPPKKKDILAGKLVEAAIAIVEKDGFKSLTVRAVTARAGCAIGMVYKIFRNLDDLALHVNAATLDKIGDDLARPIKRADPAGAVMELARRYIAFSRRNFNLWSMIFEHRMARRLPPWFDEKIRRNFLFVETAVAPLTYGDKARAARSARALWAALHGLCMLSISGKLDSAGAQSATVLAADLVENYLAGLARGRRK